VELNPGRARSCGELVRKGIERVLDDHDFAREEA
jgi:hypothetical protein